MSLSSTSDKIAEWSSLAYEDTDMAAGYTGGVKSTSLISLLSIDVFSRSDIYHNNVSYATTVSDSVGIWDWASPI